MLFVVSPTNEVGLLETVCRVVLRLTERQKRRQSSSCLAPHLSGILLERENDFVAVEVGDLDLHRVHAYIYGHADIARLREYPKRRALARQSPLRGLGCEPHVAGKVGDQLGFVERPPHSCMSR